MSARWLKSALRIMPLAQVLVAGCLVGTCLSGCDRKEKVLDVDTPGADVNVERDTDTGEVDVNVDVGDNN